MLVFGSAICGAVLALLTTGCATPSQALLDKAAQHTLTGTRIAACVESVLAEEEERRALSHKLAEIEAEQEAERIREATAEAAREHSPTTKEEIDKVLRDGGTAK